MFPIKRDRSIADHHHSIRDPYLNNAFSSVTIWENSLMKTRIPDLFKTKGGLPGHVVQIQQELNRIGNTNGRPPELVARATNAVANVRNAVKSSLEAAQERPELGLPAGLRLIYPLINDGLIFSVFY